MPAYVERRRRIALPMGPSRRRAENTAAEADRLEIGLINNMPDAALQATERQVLSLLHAAAGDLHVRVRHWSLPGLPRSEYGERRIAERYEPFASLFGSRLDALIVTGSEPRQSDLRKEPYWDAFVRLFDWAAANTVSTMWSCLAAHAAVFHADGIERRPLADKLFGVFACEAASVHPLLRGLPAQIYVPHSRWNAIDEAALRGAGYEILTRSNQLGADIFVKRNGSLFLFMQGHPEYDVQSLMLEYRRDVGRYLTGERDAYPNMPQNYFDAATSQTLLAFRSEAMANRSEAALARFPIEAAAKELAAGWRPNAELIFGNWLSHIAHAKSLQAQSSHNLDLRPRDASR